MIKTLSVSLVLATILSMSGCGSSSNDDITPPPSSEDITNNTTVSGKVADGYLDKAKVCLDKNENGKCDLDEPNTLSVNGDYDLNITSTDVGKYPILVEVTTSTIDLDDGNLVTKPYTLTAPKDSTGFISPITTLIKSQIDKNPALTTDEATSIVSKELNITSDNSKLLTDYVVNENSDTISKKLHEVGKIVAKLIVDIEENIKITLGITDISNEQRAGLSKIVNDVALDNIATITSKIKDDNKTISELTSEISTIVNDNPKTQDELNFAIIETKQLIQEKLIDTNSIFNNSIVYRLTTSDTGPALVGYKFTNDIQYGKIVSSNLATSNSELQNLPEDDKSSRFDEISVGVYETSIIKDGESKKLIVKFTKTILYGIDYTTENTLSIMFGLKTDERMPIFRNNFTMTDANNVLSFTTEDEMIKYTVIIDGEIQTVSAFFNKSAMDKILNILNN